MDVGCTGFSTHCPPNAMGENGNELHNTYRGRGRKVKLMVKLNGEVDVDRDVKPHGDVACAIHYV